MNKEQAHSTANQYRQCAAINTKQKMSMSSREGRKRLIDAFDEISNKKQHTFSAAGPLCTVVACLTGLSAEKKTSLHGMIESLGGR